MDKIILSAVERTEKPNIVRKAGFIPGVLDGPGTASVSVKFDTAEFNKIIAKHGANAKMWVKLGSKEKFGYIKEIQKNPVEGKILHVAIQIVAQDKDVKMQMPIIFRGTAELERKLLQLQVQKADVEIFGKATSMPDEVIVDVSKKNAGENVAAADFHLPSGIKVLDSEHEIYAIIKNAKTEAATESADDAKAEE